MIFSLWVDIDLLLQSRTIVGKIVIAFYFFGGEVLIYVYGTSRH